MKKINLTGFFSKFKKPNFNRTINMKLSLYRYSSSKDDTLGLLFIDGKFSSYTLEDEYREEKVYGETRIPMRQYRIKLKKFGGMHKKYSKKYDWHVGMLHLQNVPNFSDVYLHIGNREDETLGCVIMGDSVQSNLAENGFVGNSVTSYSRLYKVVSKHLLAGGDVYINIFDEKEWVNV